MPSLSLRVQIAPPLPPPQPGSSSARPGNNKRFRFLLLTRTPQAGHVLSRSWNVGKERHSNQYINVKQDQEHCMFQQNIKSHKKTIYPLLKFEFQFVMVYFASWLLSHITRWRSLSNQQSVISAPDPHQLTLNTSFQHLKQHTWSQADWKGTRASHWHLQHV